LGLAAQKDDLDYQYLALNLILAIVYEFDWAIDELIERASIPLLLSVISHPHWEMQRLGFLILACINRTEKGRRLSIETQVFPEMCNIFRALNREGGESPEVLEILAAISQSFQFMSPFLSTFPSSVTARILNIYFETFELRSSTFLADALVFMEFLIRNGADNAIREIYSSGILRPLFRFSEDTDSSRVLSIFRLFLLILCAKDLDLQARVLSEFNTNVFKNLIINTAMSSNRHRREVFKMSVRILQNISCLTKDFSWIFDEIIYRKLSETMDNSTYDEKVCLSQLLFSCLAWGSVSVVRQMFSTKFPFLALEAVGSDQPCQFVVNCLFAIDRAINCVLKMGIRDYQLFDEFRDKCGVVLEGMLNHESERVSHLAEALLERQFPEVYYRNED
jgi:hypothetical protein